MKKTIIISIICLITTVCLNSAVAISLTVDGRDNAIFLDSSVASRIAPMPAGDYLVEVTGDAFYVGEQSHGDVLVRYAGADGLDHLSAFEIGSTTSLSLRDGYMFSAFFADWSSLGDNSGEIAIKFYEASSPSIVVNTLTVDGRDNAIFLDSSVASRIAPMPGGDYLFEVTGDAFYVGEQSHGDVLVRYAGADGLDHLSALEIGSSTRLSLRDGYMFSAFFADWSSLGDNSGEITITATVVPEPVSSVLFVVGGSLLARRRYIKRKK